MNSNEKIEKKNICFIYLIYNINMQDHLTQDSGRIYRSTRPTTIVVSSEFIIDQFRRRLEGLSDGFHEFSNHINTSKYKFFHDSDEICLICLENFNLGQNVCVSSCYHCWCDKCESKFTNNLCPFCRKTLEPNIFLDSKGEKDFFQKTEHEMKIINIIKNDTDKNNNYKISMDEVD